MKNVHRKTGTGRRVISMAVAVVSALAVTCLLAACTQASSSPSGKYVLTIQNNGYCTTVPSGVVLVDPGAVTTITANANAGHIWNPAYGWTVVSGTASIANAGQAATTVTLNAGDATIRASCP
jgi:hypothetical protein